MFAVLEISGHQFILEKGQKFTVDRMEVLPGTELELTDVLLLNEDGKEKVQVGTPYVEGAKIIVRVVEHDRGEKIRVFKMKAKKRSRKTQGHRSDLTILEVLDIVK